MNVVQHTKYIWQLEDFIPHNEIDYFLGMFDFHNPGTLAGFRNKLRNNDTYLINEYQEMDEMGWKWVNAANSYYIKENSWIYHSMLSDKKEFDTMKWKGQNVIRMYNESDSYDWHCDQSPRNIAEFSYIIYLSDEFDGGETRFMHDKITVSPKKGTVLCFPVDHYHIHKGVKVSNGIKKILWNCVYRHEITVIDDNRYLRVTNTPRSSKRTIW